MSFRGKVLNKPIYFFGSKSLLPGTKINKLVQVNEHDSSMTKLFYMFWNYEKA